MQWNWNWTALVQWNWNWTVLAQWNQNQTETESSHLVPLVSLAVWQQTEVEAVVVILLPLK